jgi:hypothetical protein
MPTQIKYRHLNIGEFGILSPPNRFKKFCWTGFATSHVSTMNQIRASNVLNGVTNPGKQPKILRENDNKSDEAYLYSLKIKGVST